MNIRLARSATLLLSITFWLSLAACGGKNKGTPQDDAGTDAATGCLPKSKIAACGDRECGIASNGCDGVFTCGTGTCADPSKPECANGVCSPAGTCTPSCEGKTCGQPNTCDTATCPGACPANQMCNDQNQCVDTNMCSNSCDGLCGGALNGCGMTCDAPCATNCQGVICAPDCPDMCTGGKVCDISNNTCVDDPCIGKVCGYFGPNGGACGDCSTFPCGSCAFGNCSEQGRCDCGVCSASAPTCFDTTGACGCGTPNNVCPNGKTCQNGNCV